MGLIWKDEAAQKERGGHWTRRQAEFSEDSKYRYTLITVWDSSKPMLGGLFCNPSKASATVTDNTDRLFRALAERNGYGGTWIANLFAIIGTRPKVIKDTARPIGPKNTNAIIAMAQECGDILCAWGNNADYLQQPEVVLEVLRSLEKGNPGRIKLYYLTMTKEGQPGHPLYLSTKLPLVRWR